MHKPLRFSLSPTLAILVASAAGLSAQARVLSAEDYLQPPTKIRNVLESEALWRQESMSNLQPGGHLFLLSRREGMVPLERLSRPYVNLGETPIDHRANRGRRLSTGTTLGYELHDPATGKRHEIQTPADAIVSGATWSPDGKRIAFFAHYDDASYLYVADAASGKSRRVCERKLSLTLTSSFRWSWDGKKLLATLTPKDRGQMPEASQTPREPQVWVSHDGKTPSRTYRFLLKTPHDARLLEWLATSQLALIDVDGGAVQEIGKPAMIRSADLSPDSRYFRVSTMQKPFSYFVPARSFGSKDELWDKTGKTVHKFSERKLRIGGQQGAARRGRGGQAGASRGDAKRSLSWRPDGKGMSFLQLEPVKKAPAKKGDAKKGDAKADAKKGDGKADAPAKPVDADAAARARRAAMMRARRAQGGAARPQGGRATRRARRDAGAGRGQGRRGPGAARGQGRRGPAGRGQGARGARTGTQGAAAAGPKRKDRVMLWKPPYGEKDVVVVWESDDPIRSVRYSKDCRRIYVTQTKDGKTQLFAVDLKKPKVRLPIHEYKAGATPQDPRMARIPARFRGRFRGMGGGAPRLMTKSRGAASYVRTSKDGKSVFMQGRDEPKDAAKESARAWIDRIEVATRKKKRVWQAAKGDFAERLLTIMDDDIKQVVVSRESNTIIPNSWLVDTATGDRKRLTDNRDPAPEVTAAKRIRFQVTRCDGFKFWVNVTVPNGYGERLPAIFWFYPREFTDQKSYDERAKRSQRPHRFPMMRTRSMELLTMLGYVVVQPDCPIVGPTGRMNDNYVPDLRNSLWAVIDECDKRRIIDRDRLAIGGHSYGAFGTANAMIHTPFFKAGIAGDGNYNRTLTPMSFQAERRYLWDAREVYTRMSPLLWANQLQGALLMYHGMDDNNTGTFPINSPRMFQALDGLGKTTALYQYPYEGHAPVSRESVHDLWARWAEWLDLHVKNHGKKKPAGGKVPDKDITERRD